jgi:hypothetical protein
MSRTVSRTVQNRTGLTIRRICRQLSPLRSATIAINGAVRTFPPAIAPDDKVLLDAITRRRGRALTK